MNYLDNMIKFNNDVNYQNFQQLETRSQEEREKEYADASVTDKSKFVQLAESTLPKLEQLKEAVGKKIFKTAKQTKITAIKKRISDQIDYQKKFINEHTEKKTESIGQTTFQSQKVDSSATEKPFEPMPHFESVEGLLREMERRRVDQKDIEALREFITMRGGKLNQSTIQLLGELIELRIPLAKLWGLEDNLQREIFKNLDAVKLLVRRGQTFDNIVNMSAEKREKLFFFANTIGRDMEG